MLLEIERFVTTDPDELLRLRFSRLKSSEICKKLLLDKYRRKGITPDQNLINEKAKGLSSAIDSALNYWQMKEQGLNARILSRYYAFLQFTIAEEVASIENESNLKEAQKHTEQGHGLNTLNQYEGTNFLDSFFCYFRSNGHFYYYLQQIGFSKDEEFFSSKRIKSVKGNDSVYLISLSDLFRRIPELQDIIEEYTEKCPLVLNFGLDSIREHEKTEVRREAYSKETGTFQFFAPPETDENVVTYVTIYPSSENMTIEYLQGLKTPFTNFELKKDKSSGSVNIACDFHHPNEGLWWNSIESYKSAYCPTSFIVPVFNKISDPVIINYALMYSLSIIVRYLPDIWYELTVGNLNNIGSLIDYYLAIFDHVIPKQMLERITGKRIHISMPGGWDAPT